MFFFCSKSSETSKKIDFRGCTKIEEGGDLCGGKVKIAVLAYYKLAGPMSLKLNTCIPNYTTIYHVFGLGMSRYCPAALGHQVSIELAEGRGLGLLS